MIAIDQDQATLPRAKQLQRTYGKRFRFARGNFADLSTILKDERVDGVLMDLGVSSMQLSTADRGFSLRRDFEGPLDMRMDSSGPITAADVVNELDEQQLHAIIKTLGDEPRAASVAKAIVKARRQGKLTRTSELVDVVVSSRPRTTREHHPATLTFQALRMFVNDELGSLRRALIGAEDRLREGGVLALLTFHSGEARMWKDAHSCVRMAARECA